MHANPFPSSQWRARCPLELVHSDVHQVPYPSFSGFHYWVTFIDDYSRFRFVLFKAVNHSLSSQSVALYILYSKNSVQYLEFTVSCTKSNKRWTQYDILQWLVWHTSVTYFNDFNNILQWHSMTSIICSVINNQHSPLIVHVSNSQLPPLLPSPNIPQNSSTLGRASALVRMSAG